MSGKRSATPGAAAVVAAAVDRGWRVTPKNRWRRLWLAVGWVMLIAGLTAFVVFVLLPGWSGG
jgi:hypothetical protein